MDLLEKLCFDEFELPTEAKLLYQLRSKIKFWNERLAFIALNISTNEISYIDANATAGLAMTAPRSVCKH